MSQTPPSPPSPEWPPSPPNAQPGLRDAIVRAATDPQFAEVLTTNPESVAQAYNLSPDAVARIKQFAQSGAMRTSSGGVRYYG